MERYEVLEEIGKGSFGVVFKAKHLETGAIVAMKIIKRMQDGRMYDLKSMGQEYQILKNLKHPNIVTLLEAFETNKEVIVVTEYAPMDLHGYLSREKKLTAEKMQPIACNLVSALYYLHSHRILHRDIKPQNVLIGANEEAKVCDFGFARTMSVDQFMLTSFKGTPLYMAPEIIQEKPYDHKADLWSMGCILYEVVVGEPPFSADKMIELCNKVKSSSIFWPPHLNGDCLSFLMGLLRKDPEERLSWPDLLKHPFVMNGVQISNLDYQFSLTKELSASQELAKERQRQHLERKLANYTHILSRAKKKYDEAQRRLRKCSKECKITGNIYVPNYRPGGRNNNSNEPSFHLAAKKKPESAPNPVEKAALFQKFDSLRLNEKVSTKNEIDSNSSCETLTSSSELESVSDLSEDGKTVIMDVEGATQSVKKFNQVSAASDSGNISLDGKGEKVANGNTASGGIWKSGALFTLHSFGSEEKPIMSEEWVSFLVTTMKEVVDNPKSLCEKHFLTVIVAPLRNHLAGPEVIEKIATLLSIPFIFDLPEPDEEAEINLRERLQNTYLDNKVLPNLLYACKLIIQKRRLERNILEISEISSVLTVEDLDAFDKCFRLVCYLVHMDEDFVIQFCDSVCVLQAFMVLKIFLKLHKRKSRLTAETLAILCHIMRTVPSNVNILEELIMSDRAEKSGKKEDDDFWRLLQHPNSFIKSRAIRMLAYLVVHSEKANEKIVRRNCSKIWRLLQESLSSLEDCNRMAAEFALDNLRHIPSLCKNEVLKTDDSQNRDKLHHSF